MTFNFLIIIKYPLFLSFLKFIPLDYMVYMFKFDSTHTGFERSGVEVVATKCGKLSINGRKITVFCERDPKDIPWASAGYIFE